MYTTVDGVSLYYEQHGMASSGIEIIMLHGWGCDSTFFGPIVQALCEYAHITVIDFPGHGKSGRPPVPFGAKEFAQNICGLMDALNIKKAIIIGHSHGGRVALYMGSKYADYIQKLIITGGAGIKKEATEAQKKQSEKYQKKKKLYETLSKIGLLRPVINKLAEGLRQKYGSPDYKALDSEMRKTFVKTIQSDLRDELKHIQAPTLLVWGSEDTETPLWMGQLMEKEIPDAGLVVFEQGGHYAYLEQWQRFVLIIKSFIGIGGK